MLNPDLNITIWGIFSVVLTALTIFFVLIRKTKFGKIKTLSKVVVVVVVVVGSYLLVAPKLNQDQAVNTSSVPQFPLTGPDPAPQVFVQFLKSLYATPREGLVTSFFLILIIFMVFKIIKPDKRQIEKDLEDAKIAAAKFLEDLGTEKEKLAERIKELETLNKIMVGRELKMIELKKEIADLKKKVI